MPKKVAFYTLGCKLNFSETSTISRIFTNNNFEKVGFEEKADIYVINTCSVTENANRKCRQIVKQARQYSPNAYVAVIGCYAQLKPDEIANIPGVDIVLGAAEKFNLLDYINNIEKNGKAAIHHSEIDHVNQFVSSFSIGDRTRSFLKVQDGCDYSCSFCTIPLARGKSRSDTIENIVNLAQEIAGRGVKEIVLSGVNIGDFGKQPPSDSPTRVESTNAQESQPSFNPYTKYREEPTHNTPTTAFAPELLKKYENKTETFYVTNVKIRVVLVDSFAKSYLYTSSSNYPKQK